MTLRCSGSRAAISGPRSAAVGAPQHSGQAHVAPAERVDSNNRLMSLMRATLLRAKRRAPRFATRVLFLQGREKTRRIIANPALGKGGRKIIFCAIGCPAIIVLAGQRHRLMTARRNGLMTAWLSFSAPCRMH